MISRFSFSSALFGTAIAATAALTLAGCSAAAPAAVNSPSAAPAESATSTAAAFPLSLDNCGFAVTFQQAPERVVTIKSSTLELLLTLGLADRVVGYAFPDGPLPTGLEQYADEMVLLADKVPAQEATLALAPDLVFAGWESNLTAEGAGDRETLAKLGVNTYVAPAACKGEGYVPTPLTFDFVFDGFKEAGEIFTVPEQAQALVAEQSAELAAITPDSRGLSALWYSSGEGTPFVGAGLGAPEMIMSAAGLNNVFADVPDTWTSASWEAIVDKNPDVIVLVDAAWNTAESKIAHLQENPATAALDAVKNNKFIVIDFAETEAGVRNVGGVKSLVEQLKNK